MDRPDQGPLYRRLEQALQWPMMLLTILFMIAIILPLQKDLNAEVTKWASIAEIAIWACFLAEYVLLLCIAKHRVYYLRTHIMEAAMVALPAFRVLRVARLVRFGRLLSLFRLPVLLVAGGQGLHRASTRLRHYRMGYISSIALIILLISSGLMLYLERGANPDLDTYPRCLWWGMVTMTTVGYGDAAPVTAGGRAVAMLFMIVGIGMAGVITAMVASIFVSIERSDEDKAAHARFDTLEKQLLELRVQIAELTELQQAQNARSQQEAS